MNIEEALRAAQASLNSASDAPRWDAERLLLSILGKEESSWLYAHKDATVSRQDHSRFQQLVQERAAGKPLAYILGEWEFYGRPFYITEHVLVPRPATENLIAAALPYIDVWRDTHSEKQMVIADIGTGSGVIAITLALELAKFSTSTADPPKWRGNSTFHFIATDISPAALDLAKKNAERHGVTNHIEFLQGDMLKPLKGRHVDFIVSNPPYIPTRELESHFAKASRDESETQGLRFEPRIALDGGADGQDFVRRIQEYGTPALVESTGGSITKFNQEVEIS